MNLKIAMWAIAALVALLAGYIILGLGTATDSAANISPQEGPVAEDHHQGGENHAEEEEGHDEGSRTTIEPDSAKQSGIEVEEVGSHALRESLPLTGKIILNPNASAEIKARFPGVVRKVEKAIGQPVNKGEALAYVESNDSLQTYAVTSPLTGIVLTRHASVGDTASDEAMFTVADLDTVMGEFHVFPKDISRIQTGQTVQVQSVDGLITADGEVKSLLPVADANTQTVMAWVILDNKQERWRPGMAVQGGAVVSEQEVPLAVKNAAIQTLNDGPVVFVQENGNVYEARPVKLGRSDGLWTEVMDGLTAGEKYVSKNSFVVKADIGKAGAEHEH